MIPLKYSCEEIYERMENGLCIFCEEQDIPGHQLKHKRLRLVMIEPEDNLPSDYIEEVHQIQKSVKSLDPFVETVKNSDLLIEPLECASVLQVLDSVSDELMVHKVDSHVKEVEESPQQSMNGNGKNAAHQVFDQMPLRVTSKEKQRKSLKAWKFKFKPSSKRRKSMGDEFSLVEKTTLFNKDPKEIIWDCVNKEFKETMAARGRKRIERFKLDEKKTSKPADYDETIQVPFSSLEPSRRCHKESPVVVNDLSSNLQCVIGKTNECICDHELGQANSLDEKEFIWFTFGKLSKNERRLSVVCLLGLMDMSCRTQLLKQQICPKSWSFKYRYKARTRVMTTTKQLHTPSSCPVLLLGGDLNLALELFVSINHEFSKECGVLNLEKELGAGNVTTILESYGSRESVYDGSILLEVKKGLSLIGSVYKKYSLLKMIYVEFLGRKGHCKNLLDAEKKMQPRLFYDEEKNELRNIEARIPKAFRKLLVCLDVHDLKFEAELEIYISAYHISIVQKLGVMYHCLATKELSWSKKLQEASCFLLEKPFVEFVRCKTQVKRVKKLEHCLIVLNRLICCCLRDTSKQKRQELGSKSKEHCLRIVVQDLSVTEHYLLVKLVPIDVVLLIRYRWNWKLGELHKQREIIWDAENMGHNHLKQLLAAREGSLREIACCLIGGDGKFHLKHKWKSRLLQTLSGLDFCVDNFMIIASSVKLLFPKNHKLLQPEAGFCTLGNDLEQLSTDFQSSPCLDYFIHLIFIWNQALFCGCEADHISSGILSIGDVHEFFTCSKLQTGDETQGKRLLVLNEISLLVDFTVKETWVYNKPMLRGVFHLQRPPELIDLHGDPNFITKVLVQWKEHPPDQFSQTFGGKFLVFHHP